MFWFCTRKTIWGIFLVEIPSRFLDSFDLWSDVGLRMFCSGSRSCKCFVFGFVVQTVGFALLENVSFAIGTLFQQFETIATIVPTVEHRALPVRRAFAVADRRVDSLDFTCREKYSPFLGTRKENFRRLTKILATNETSANGHQKNRNTKGDENDQGNTKVFIDERRFHVDLTGHFWTEKTFFNRWWREILLGFRPLIDDSSNLNRAFSGAVASSATYTSRALSDTAMSWGAERGFWNNKRSSSEDKTTMNERVSIRMSWGFRRFARRSCTLSWLTVEHHRSRQKGSFLNENASRETWRRSTGWTNGSHWEQSWWRRSARSYQFSPPESVERTLPSSNWNIEFGNFLDQQHKSVELFRSRRSNGRCSTDWREEIRCLEKIFSLRQSFSFIY